MKSARIVAVACSLFLVSVVAFAQTPTSQVPLTREAIAAILGLSPATGGCAKAAEPSQVVFAAQKPGPGGGVSESAYCEVPCETGSVSCDVDISCQAYQRNCTTACERGHVTCTDSVQGTFTVSCPTTCPGGTNCCNCNQTGDCVACCLCDGGTFVRCNNCCTCEQTQDCIACCRCEGHSLSYCASLCG